jgi:Fe2+ transport system protein B
MLSWWIGLIDFVPLFITVVVVGRTAWWVVNRSNEKTRKIELTLEEAKANAERDIAAVYKQSGDLLEKARADRIKAIQENNNLWNRKIEEERTKAEALNEETRAQAMKEIEENRNLWKRMIEEAQKDAEALLKDTHDKHTAEVLKLANMVKRLRDNLDQLNEENKEKRSKENKIPNPVRKTLELSADIIIQEVPCDLIKESDALLEKYNL